MVKTPHNGESSIKKKFIFGDRKKIPVRSVHAERRELFNGGGIRCRRRNEGVVFEIQRVAAASSLIEAELHVYISKRIIGSNKNIKLKSKNEIGFFKTI